MLNPRYQRYAVRLQALIKEGEALIAVAQITERGATRIADEVALQAWLTKVRNILAMVFGKGSPQFWQYQEVLPRNGIRDVYHPSQAKLILGVLTGALDDLEQGFLIGQEFFIAGEVFDSVLEQAKYLNQKGHKDPAAVLGRVVLEDALKRIAKAEGIDKDSWGASRINDELRKIQRYGQPQWRQVQAWLDVGNAAAHGNFQEYDTDLVKNTINGIEQFLVNELRA